MTEHLARQADALWRAITYISVAQLHLRANPLLTEPLTSAHVKEHPAGHWGTVPGTAFALSHLALAGATVDGELVPILGAGHAGLAQASLAWLTGDLAAIRPQFSPDADGLTRLVAAFPHLGGVGAEVSPSLPAGWYLGGQLGGALPFAQGAALDAPHRLVAPVLGDGECETPTTAAAWLAARALPSRAMVLPIIHVNGYRMGGTSLLGGVDDDALRAYATGLGWRSHVVHVQTASTDEHREFHTTLTSAADAVREHIPTLIFLRCVKGWSGPSELSGRAVLGTPGVHKTPITNPRHDPEQLAILKAWLASYRPAELFTPGGAAAGALTEVVDLVRHGVRTRLGMRRPPSNAEPVGIQHGSFADAVTAVLRRHASDGDLLVLSPDELASNRLGHLAGETWCAEVLAEEVLLGWLAGWTTTGRRGLLVSYEAFAPLFATGVVQLLKQRRVASTSSSSLPSLNLLLTSYGWHNTYTHGDPSLSTALLATRDNAVRVLTPADPSRLGAALDGALRSVGRINVIVAGKHATTSYPLDTLELECRRGLAIWPQASDDGEPDLVLVAAGDLPAGVACEAAPLIRRRYRLRVRVIGVQELTVLGHPATWSSGLSDAEIEQYFGATAPLIIATLGHPAAVWGLIEDRLRRPVEVIGWREPDGPMPQHLVAARAGMDVTGLCAAAERLFAAGQSDSGKRNAIFSRRPASLGARLLPANGAPA